MFPNLFRLIAQKNARVVDLWDWDSGDGGWNPIFLRSFNDWEMEEVIGFYKPCIENKSDLSWRTKSSSKAPGMMLFL